MPTVIDSLVVELGLDATKFKSGGNEISDELTRLRVESERAGGDVERQGRKTADVLLDIKREALGLLAIFLGGRGIKEFVGYVMSTEAAAGRLGKTMDMSARAVSAWGGAFQQIGGTTEGANSALKGLSDEMSRFSTTGQSSMLGVLTRLGVGLYDQNHQLKTSGQLWLELADAVKGMDPRQAVSFLKMIPGANDEMINFALLGRRAMEQYINSADKAWAITQKDVQAAQEFQQKIGLIERSATGLGASFLRLVTPAIISGLDKVTDLLNRLQGLKESPDGVSPPAAGRHDTVQRFGSPRRVVEYLRDHLSLGDEDKAKWDAIATKLYGAPGADERDAATVDLGEQLRARAAAVKAGGGPGDERSAMAGYDAPVASIEQKIRQAAIARGIDPEIAVAVSKSEGLYNYKSTVPGEESYGPFQLHYGGRGQTGALARSGLGDAFTAQTGKHAEDPSTIDAQIAFALDYAKANGWGPWYGWKGLPTAGGAGVGRGGGAAPGARAAAASASVTTSQVNHGDTTTTKVDIGQMNINAPGAKDADGIANHIGPALNRSVTAGNANVGGE